ncbi:hypothetical protein KKE45_00620 [Patescibacteria group bacterium]|nr:hypothetical protein [Patescibacteria group bacterium]
MKPNPLFSFLIFIILLFWFLAAWPQISKNPPIPPEIKKVKAEVSSLVVTSCEVNDSGGDSTCYNAIVADGGTSDNLTKNAHLDAPFQTLIASSVTSATLYYDSWADLSGTWEIHVKDARDGNTICSVNPAPEDLSETRNNVDCSSITTTQLSDGVWLYARNNDGGPPQSVNLDYIYLYVDYVAPSAVSITLTTDGSVSFGILDLGTSQDTSGDIEFISVDTGPADLDVKSTNFTQGANTWFLNTGSGTTQVQWEFSKDASAWTTFALIDTLYELDTNVGTGETRPFYLRLSMPTSTDSYDQYASTVTIVASAP